MNLTIDRQMLWLVEAVVAVLVAASLAGFFLARRVQSEAGKAAVDKLNARIRAWWIMIGVFALALVLGRAGALLLFAFVSFLALREYVGLVPTLAADHRTLLWSFFVFTPIQYWVLYQGWYGLSSVMIPVYAFLFLPLRMALAYEPAGFLDRASRIHWGLMICVYCLSYAPALLILEIPGYQHQSAKLLLFLALVVQCGDIARHVWGRVLSKNRIAPMIFPTKTWEGLLGVAAASLLGMGLWWMTPFSPFMALGMALLAGLLGFAGSLVMSAVKRDRPANDSGNMMEDRGGILDRVDSLCFSAPVFFHLTRYFFVTHGRGP